MDVFKRIVLLSSSLLLMQCQSNKDEVATTSFVKSGTQVCVDQEIQGEYLVVWKNGQVSVEHFESEQQFLEDFIALNEDKILKAEPHYKLNLIEAIDSFERGWGGGVNWGVDAVEASLLWNKSAESGDEIIVAVIDSGLDTSHPELQGVLSVNENETLNGLDDDGNGLIDDISGYDFLGDSGDVIDYTGHGTHVSGVIVARHDIGQVLGVAPNVKLLPLGFIGRGGAGGVDGAIRAIRYAKERKAKVINASWGGSNCSTSLREEIENLASSNILFVTAAGNSGNDLNISPEFPAAFVLDNIITVGASTVDRKVASFSNYGLLVDVVAPGANIVSTYPVTKDILDGSQDGLVSLNGTSMASPFVAGAAALLWTQKPTASYTEIKLALLAGVQPGPFFVETRGELNIRLALEALNP